MAEGNGADTWPASYPDRCPPPGATKSESTFYRLLFGSAVAEDDFLSTRIAIERGLKPPLRGKADPCLIEGVSLFDSLENLGQVIPASGSTRSRAIARGSLSSSGVVLRTGRNEGHHTWWRPEGETAWLGFEVDA